MKIDTTIQNSYSQLSSGKRINSAADDPAGLSISQQMTAQVKGYDAGTANVQTAKDLTTTAGDALGSINDQLQRMRELAVQASNGIYTAEDKVGIQQEIDQLKTSINSVGKGTEFNTIKLLDGSFSDKNVASGPSGTGKTMSIQNSSLESLGIADFDVTKTFDIATIDSAITKVSDSRASLGATSNALDAQVNINETASYNLSASESQISSADIAKTASDLKQQQMLQQVQVYAQKMKMSQGAGVLNLLT